MGLGHFNGQVLFFLLLILASSNSSCITQFKVRLLLTKILNSKGVA